MLLTVELFTPRSLVYSITTNSHQALSAIRSSEIVTNFQSHFPSGPTRRKSALPPPTRERRAQEALSLPEPSCWKLSTAGMSHWTRKSESDLAAQEHPWIQPEFKATTIEDKFRFFPILLKFYWVVYILSPCTVGLMHLRSFFPLCEGRFSFVSGCHPDVGIGNSKHTMREFIACPGYVGNSSLLLGGPNSGNTPVMWLL